MTEETRVTPRSALLESTLSLATMASDAAPHLLVFHAGSMSAVRLSLGTYLIGRDADVPIAIDDPSLSRRQASLTISEHGALISDLGSQNGTRVNGRMIQEPTALSSGDVIGFGHTQLVLCHGGDSPVPRVLGREDFEHRVACEVERSLRYLRPLSILLLGGGRRASDDELLVESLAEAMRPLDVLGRLDRGSLAVMIPESSPVVEEAIFHAASRADGKIKGGLARWPDDAGGAPSLLDAARAAGDEARPGQLARATQLTRTLVVGDTEVVFADSSMIQLFALVERLGPLDSPVLICGETGSGKEIVARALHDRSPRSAGPFVAINSATLSDQLGEADLFGHERGAFTGADVARPGQFEAARGGTLFLDEIGEMTPAVQAKLLRAIETRMVRRLGANAEQETDVRVIAATNRDLIKERDRGAFRADLFFRLNAATLYVPPLRRRPRDIPVLAQHLARALSARMGRPPPAISAPALRVLETHPWPGNVRELRNELGRALAMSSEPVLEPWMFFDAPSNDRGDERGTDDSPGTKPFRPLDEELRDLERLRIEQALAFTGGVQTRAAALLGVPIRTFYMKVKQYGIEPGRKAKSTAG